MIKGAIFDMDGTLIDSMPIWEHASEQYLKGLGIEVKEKLSEVLFSMSMKQGAAYVKEQYGLSQEIEEIVAGVNKVVVEFYQTQSPLKPGVKQLLKQYQAAGVKMVVATATDRVMAEAALTRSGIIGYFDRIFTCTGVGAGKSSPDIFLAAWEALGTPKLDTWVFEDARYAIATAKEAGFQTVGLYDAARRKEQKEIEGLADFYFENILEANILIGQDERGADEKHGIDNCGE